MLLYEAAAGPTADRRRAVSELYGLQRDLQRLGYSHQLRCELHAR